MTGLITRILRAITGRRAPDPAALAQLEWESNWDRAAALVRASIEASWREQGLDPADPALLRALNVEVAESMRAPRRETSTGQKGAQFDR